MKTTTTSHSKPSHAVEDVLKMEPDQGVRSIRGLVKNVFSWNEVKSEDGSASVQMIGIEDGGKKLLVKLWNHVAISEDAVGKTVTFRSGPEGKKGSLMVRRDEKRTFLEANQTAIIDLDGESKTDEAKTDHSKKGVPADDLEESPRKTPKAASDAANRPPERKKEDAEVDAVKEAKIAACRVANVYRVAVMVSAINRADFMEQLGWEMPDEHFRSMVEQTAHRLLNENVHATMPSGLVPLVKKKDEKK